ncbi:MAG TPA: DUF480 domain-containing protein, partial [Gemmatales bacterium]|nr:DUF480 domain-containing protein [Gemmatales bacterium]
APPAGSPSWPDLSLQARRVLGVLIEKGKTTPDNYPLTLNGLVAGCNQKSNRDPVLELVDAEVEVAVDELKRLGYTEQVMGSGRTDKFRHVLYNALRVGRPGHPGRVAPAGPADRRGTAFSVQSDGPLPRPGDAACSIAEPGGTGAGLLY